MQEVIPWPVSLGIAGFSVLTLFSFLVWFLKQLGSNKLQTESQVNALVAAGDRQTKQLIDGAMLRATDQIAAAVQRATEQIASEKLRGDEWKETALVEREGRLQATEVARMAVEQNKINDHFYETMMPKRFVVPQMEDNGGTAGGD